MWYFINRNHQICYLHMRGRLKIHLCFSPDDFSCASVTFALKCFVNSDLNLLYKVPLRSSSRVQEQDEAPVLVEWRWKERKVEWESGCYTFCFLNWSGHPPSFPPLECIWWEGKCCSFFPTPSTNCSSASSSSEGMTYVCVGMYTCICVCLFLPFFPSFPLWL